MTISVVMSVYNGEKYLDQAIRSIRNQTLADHEFVIVNDGSSDGSAEIIASHAADDARIRVLEQANQGLIVSLNRGCAEARGELIARMDADDVSLPDRLATQATFLAHHPEIAAVGGAAVVTDEHSAGSERMGVPTRPAEINEALLTHNAIIHSTVMMRRSAFRAAGGYRAAFVGAEDYDLWLRMAERGELANLTDVLVLYRRHSHQVSTVHCWQQTLSGVAARFAARRRRETGSDPFADAGALDHATLLRAGVPPEEIERAALGVPLSLARAFLAAGRAQEASDLLGEIRKLLRAQPSSRGARQKAALWTGMALLARCDPLHGAGWRALGVVVRPRRLARAMRARFGRTTDE